MDWEVIGNLIICSCIIGAGVLFVVVNVNYMPDKDKER